MRYKLDLDLPIIIIQVFPIMNKQKYNNFLHTTNIAQSTIDTILSQGGKRLYDRYIQTKIPKNVRASFEKIIENVFQPIANSQSSVDKGLKKVHQSFRQKINIAEQKKKNFSKLDMEGKSMFFQNTKTIQVDKDIANKISIKETLEKNEKQIKESSKFLLSLSKNVDREQESGQFQQKRVQRQQRFKQQLLREQQFREMKQKSSRFEKQLEQQLRQLQQNNKIIAFNHQTGRLFHLQQHHDYSNEQIKIHKNIINLKFGLTDQKNVANDRQRKQATVRNSRKITSFQRTRKKFNLIDQETNDSNYNNHGKRQTSSIPYMQIQEGVNILEGENIDKPINQHKNRKSRIQSASLTQRTFKSYTKEKMEYSGVARTVATATSAAKTRYLHKQTDEKKTQNFMKSSVLWSNRGDCKKHKITTNPQLINNFFVQE